MPVGRFTYRGSLGGVGDTNPTALGSTAVRLADKAGLGKTAKLSTADAKAQREFDQAAAEAFGIPKGRPSRQASKGRQNVPVVKSSPVKTAKAQSSSMTGPGPRTPKRKPS